MLVVLVLVLLVLALKLVVVLLLYDHNEPIVRRSAGSWPSGRALYD
jgi:hypothetical protein